MVKEVWCHQSWNFSEIFKHWLSWICRSLWKDWSILDKIRWRWSSAVLSVSSCAYAGKHVYPLFHKTTVIPRRSKDRVSVVFIQSIWSGSTKWWTRKFLQKIFWDWAFLMEYWGAMKWTSICIIHFRCVLGCLKNVFEIIEALRKVLRSVFNCWLCLWLVRRAEIIGSDRLVSWPHNIPVFHRVDECW